MMDGKPIDDTKKCEPINDLDALNRKYYSIFNELKAARPALANCDAAFLSFVQNITEQYQSEAKCITSQFFNTDDETDKLLERIEKFNILNERFYFMDARLKANKEMSEDLIALIKDAMKLEYQKMYKLFASEYNPEMDRKIAQQDALHERIVPKRDLWRRFLLFFKKRAQNRAADLVDYEADEKAAKVFAEQEAKIAELSAQRIYAEDLAAEFREKLKTYAEEQLTKIQSPATVDDEWEIIDETASAAEAPKDEAEQAPAQEKQTNQTESNSPPNAPAKSGKGKKKKGG